MELKTIDTRPAGYSYLLGKYALTGIPNWHRSSVSTTSSHSSNIQEGIVVEVFRSQYWPGETACDHLQFALKYDGVNLGLLSAIFAHIPQQELTEYILTRPTGKYGRRIWFFYEFLTGKQLPIEDLTPDSYINLLDEKSYYAVQIGDRSSRQRIVNNLLGPRAFCPIIRKTEKLSKLDAFDLRKRSEEVVSSYPKELLRRALSFLYKEETKSSFAIEHIHPNTSRTEKFIALLELAEKEDFCEKEKLIELQNLIVDPRFQDSEYRKSQNYVGQTVGYQKEIIHFISPKPGDLSFLMAGLIESHKRMKKGNVSPIIHAVAIAYGFVFLHPFEDGNGRIHRFLLHNILSLRNMTPQGIMFPISAVMLKNSVAYDTSLEAFSKPLLQQIDYHLGDIGQMTIEDETSFLYQYIDMTSQAEALAQFVERTIEKELVEELTFLSNYDKTKKAIQHIIDMPDRLIDLFIQMCLQNNARLSEKKRTAYFDFLTSEELAAIEQAVKDGYSTQT